MSHRDFDSSGKGVSDRFLINDKENAQKWKEYVPKILKRITFGKIAPLVDEINSYRIVQIQAAPQNRSNVISGCK